MPSVNVQEQGGLCVNSFCLLSEKCNKTYFNTLGFNPSINIEYNSVFILRRSAAKCLFIFFVLEFRSVSFKVNPCRKTWAPLKCVGQTGQTRRKTVKSFYHLGPIIMHNVVD